MINKYEKLLLDKAITLDSLTQSEGEIIALANHIIEEGNDVQTRLLLRKIGQITEEKEAYSRDVKLSAKELDEALVRFYGYNKVRDICNAREIKESNKSLQELLQELNDLVGLQRVKRSVNELIAYQRVTKLRRDRGLNASKSTLHMAFIGNPGTGKTTVARIVGQVYKQIGLLSKGHFVEVSRTDLIAGYQGQTALKVKKVIEEAKGGVLFIDEAYSLTENDHSDSYGRECLTELTKALEDYRDDLVVIVAGYSEPMEKFFESNPGLKSRFNSYIFFDDYSSDELMNILKDLCSRNDYSLSSELEEKLEDYINEQSQIAGSNFSNGRFVRNLYEQLAMKQATRIVDIDEPSLEELRTFTIDDFEKVLSDKNNTNWNS